MVWFKFKTFTYVFLSPYKGRPGSSKIIFLHLVLFFGGWGTVLACLDPDPLTQLNPDPTRILITGFNWSAPVLGRSGPILACPSSILPPPPPSASVAEM
jgi:hypothetical protein